MALQPRTQTQRTEDVPIIPGSDQFVLRQIKDFRKQSEDARRWRVRLNNRNNDVYLGRQDYTGKIPGQSREFLPKTSIATEQFTSFFKRALLSFGEWFSVEYGIAAQGQMPITEHDIVELLTCTINKMPRGPAGQFDDFATIFGDALKSALHEALMIFKIYGISNKERSFSVLPGRVSLGADGTFQPQQENIQIQENDVWRLKIDLLNFEDYYPDPTGKGLFEIHRSEMDMWEVLQLARAGIFNMAAVEELIGTEMKKEEDQRKSDWYRNQNRTPDLNFRKTVVIEEFWGSMLSENGEILHNNILAATANDRFLIRRPEPNPFWHQESPFVSIPLIRVPKSVFHKALYDDASPLNTTLNELFNLMVDGGLAAVWGVKQARVGAIVNPEELNDGIPQGKTILVNDSLPHGQKAVEQIITGDIPPETLNMFEAVSREFTSAALTSELKLGQLPQKSVLATEVIEQSQAQAVTIDGIAEDVQKGLSEVLRKSWLVLMQNLHKTSATDVASAIGVNGAMTMLQMQPTRRFALFAPLCSFKVFGLGATIAKMRDFQKTMALIQAMGSSPLLLVAFMKRFSADKIITTMMRQLNLDPRDLEKSKEELANAEQERSEVQQFGGLGNGQVGGPGTSGSPEAAEINQQSNPLTTASPGI